MQYNPCSLYPIDHFYEDFFLSFISDPPKKISICGNKITRPRHNHWFMMPNALFLLTDISFAFFFLFFHWFNFVAHTINYSIFGEKNDNETNKKRHDQRRYKINMCRGVLRDSIWHCSYSYSYSYSFILILWDLAWRNLFQYFCVLCRRDAI